jgi:hypothetical protein
MCECQHDVLCITPILRMPHLLPRAGGSSIHSIFCVEAFDGGYEATKLHGMQEQASTIVHHVDAWSEC